MKKIVVLFLISTLILSLTSCDKKGNERYIEESKLYIGYVSLEEDILKLDEFEFIKQEDKERIKDLNLSESDMPDGYYIYNESDEMLSFTISDEAEFTFFDTGNLFVSEDADKKYTTTNKEEFRRFLYQSSGLPRRVPFWVKVQGEKVISVTEEFVS